MMRVCELDSLGIDRLPNETYAREAPLIECPAPVAARGRGADVVDGRARAVGGRHAVAGRPVARPPRRGARKLRHAALGAAAVCASGRRGAAARCFRTPPCACRGCASPSARRRTSRPSRRARAATTASAARGARARRAAGWAARAVLRLLLGAGSRATTGRLGGAGRAGAGARRRPARRRRPRRGRRAPRLRRGRGARGGAGFTRGARAGGVGTLAFALPAPPVTSDSPPSSTRTDRR